MKPGPVMLLALLAASAHADIRWYGNVDRALAAAKREGKLVMLDLYAPNATGGRQLDEQAYPNPRVVEALKSVIPLRLRAASDGKAFVKKYGVRSFPTVLFLTGDGIPIWRISGPTGPLSFVKQIAKAKGMVPGLPAYRKSPSTADALAGASILAAVADDTAKARSWLNLAIKKDPGLKSVRLADAHNMLGDCHQIANRLQQAIPLFQKAATSSDNDARAYALISIGSCYLIMGDRARAKPWLQKLVDMGSKGGEWTDAARNMLRPPPQRGSSI